MSCQSVACKNVNWNDYKKPAAAVANKEEMAKVLALNLDQVKSSADAKHISFIVKNASHIGKHCGDLAVHALNVLEAVDTSESIQHQGIVGRQCPEITMRVLANFEILLKDHTHADEVVRNNEFGTISREAASIGVNCDNPEAQEAAMRINEKLARIFAERIVSLAVSEEGMRLGLIGDKNENNEYEKRWLSFRDSGMEDFSSDIIRSLERMASISSAFAMRALNALQMLQTRGYQDPNLPNVRWHSTLPDQKFVLANLNGQLLKLARTQEVVQDKINASIPQVSPRKCTCVTQAPGL